MEALGLLPSIGEWRWLVKLCSPSLRHLVYYQEGTVSPRLGLGMCDTLTLDIWALCTSPSLSYPWLSYPSTISRCHTECEIKALSNSLGLWWCTFGIKKTIGNDHKGTWKKAKVKNTQGLLDHKWKSKYIRTFWVKVKVTKNIFWVKR